MSKSLSAILAEQASLEQEAAEALPHSFSQCTYSLGYTRQAVYLCKTCATPRGICSACSIACHTDHDQLELFPKRHFRCDCPTSALPHSCTLHTLPEDNNTENTYGHNFQGRFCRCAREYDAMNERETMIQCLACEDWFHESCLNLRERPSSREPSPEALFLQEDSKNTSDAREDDAQSEASSSGLPPPLIVASDYEALVCSACVRKIDVLRRYAGTPGVLMIVRDDLQSPWKVTGAQASQDADVDIGAQDGLAATGEKRARSDSAQELNGPEVKRPRVSTESSAMPSSCLAPPPNPDTQALFSALDNPGSATSDTGIISLGAGDVFLTEDFREKWCRCGNCLSSLQAHNYLLEEEETYEPPEDPDSGLSLEELGMRALGKMPRDRAIDGIRAFNEMRDELMKHLRPFAEEGKEVTEADIRTFFEDKMLASGRQ